jgi:esterase/lipase
MSVTIKNVFKWSKIIIIIYCIIGIALFYLQDKILFHPERLSLDYQFQFPNSFKEIFIPVNKKDTIHLVQFFPDKTIDTLKSKGVVLFFHGTKGNVKDCAERVSLYTKNGYEVWMPDYPGFGKSVGLLNEKQLYEEGFQIMRLAENKFTKDEIIVQGEEFGAAIAANIAGFSELKHLILESPYKSVPDVMTTYLPIYPWSSMCHFKMPTVQFLEDVKCPVTVLTSDKSNVDLKQFLKKNDKFILVQENAETALSKTQLYEETLLSVLKDSISPLN